MNPRLALIAGLALWLVLTGTVSGQPGEGYELVGWVVPGGGDLMPPEGGYTLMGAAGQPEAGPSLKGGGYTLTGGFWVAASGDGGGGDLLYLYFPIVLKDSAQQ